MNISWYRFRSCKVYEMKQENMKIYARWVNFNKSKLSPWQLSNSPNLDALHKVGIKLMLRFIHPHQHNANG